jgi:predicted transcriptional regulator
MSEEKTETVPRQDVLRMAVDIVAAYVAQNNVNDGQIPDIILQVFGTLSELSAAPAEIGKKAGKLRFPCVVR